MVCQLSLWLSLFIVVPRDVVVLPEDEEEVPLRGRRRKDKEHGGRVLEVQVLRSTVTPGTTVERSTDPARTNTTFAVPLSTDCPSGSAAQTSAAPIQLHASDPAVAPTALPSSLFTAYQTPDDPPTAARESLLELNLVMGQMKVVHEASQVAFNAGVPPQTNVQVS